MPLNIGVAIAKGLVGLVKYPISLVSDHFRRLKKLYDFTWKSSDDLLSKDLLGDRAEEKRGFREFYYSREGVDDRLAECLNQGKNALIVGTPLAGKSRAVYEALKKHSETLDIIKPNIGEISNEDFLIPGRMTTWRKGILLLNDIDEYLKHDSFKRLIDQYLKNDFYNKYIIVSTCRAKGSLDSVRVKLDGMFSAVCQDVIQISKISNESAVKVAKDAGIEKPEYFDGNIGSIFYPLDTMRARYATCDEERKCALKSLKRLYLAGIYEGSNRFTRDRVILICQSLRSMKLEEFAWNTLLTKLQHDDLIDVSGEDILIETAYFEYVIEDAIDILDNFKKLLPLFKNDAGALYMLGDRADDKCAASQDAAHIVAFGELTKAAMLAALNTSTWETSSPDYAKSRSLLGTAHLRLANVSEKASNCRLAIAAYEEALKVYTLEGFPMNYAMTRNNLGNAYSTLAEVEEKASNCRLAIAAYEEALKVRTLEDFPMQCAMTRNNLGTAYWTL
ncbi:MAG: tetratricopeptide repeat protein, partial [candidate division Zixibacteria bacterium]|nr:tetratricopeptide repeat protein [candidate division Zixibacteria bacterium]